MTDYFTANLNIRDAASAITTTNNLSAVLSAGDRLFILGNITDSSVTDGKDELAYIERIAQSANQEKWTMRVTLGVNDLAHPANDAASRRYGRNPYALSQDVTSMSTMTIAEHMVLLSGLNYPQEPLFASDEMLQWRPTDVGRILIHGERSYIGPDGSPSPITTSPKGTLSINVSQSLWDNKPVSKQVLTDLITKNIHNT